MRYMHGRSLILQFSISNESFGSCTNSLNCILLAQLLEGLAASDHLNRCGGCPLFSPAWESGESMRRSSSLNSTLHSFDREIGCVSVEDSLVSPELPMFTIPNVIKKVTGGVGVGGWRDGSAAQSTCSSNGQGFDSQHPRGGSTICNAQVPKDLTPSVTC